LSSDDPEREGQGLGVTERLRFNRARRHDLRREPLDVRKATLRSLLVKTRPGLRWNEHIEEDGGTIFRHACKLGLEGIVSKRKDSPYRSGRSPDWLKMNPDHRAPPASAELTMG
jgi:ATP-dependent DNA ligase